MTTGLWVTHDVVIEMSHFSLNRQVSLLDPVTAQAHPVIPLPQMMLSKTEIQLLVMGSPAVVSHSQVNDFIWFLVNI